MRAADGIAIEHHVAAVGGDETDQQPRQGRLAATGFADDTEGLALDDGEGHAVDRFHLADLAIEQAAGDRKILAQLLDQKQRLGRTAAVARIAGWDETRLRAPRCEGKSAHAAFHALMSMA